MTHSERFQAIFRYEPCDRLPIYYFGTWSETYDRWEAGGCPVSEHADGSRELLIAGMDPDWERGMWECQGIVQSAPVGKYEPEVLEEGTSSRVRRTSLGSIVRESKLGSSIPHTIQPALEPNRKSWRNFQCLLDPADPARWAADWQQRAQHLSEENRVLTFMGGSLYSWLRNWMGVEAISYLMYDDPALFEDMIAYLTDYFMQVHGPVLELAAFDFVYFFEDCCGSTGPLFSPAIYRKVYHCYYKKIPAFYKEKGVPWALVDSDGNAELLVPLWLESGFDIIFPIEIGKWKASPITYRKEYGKDIRIFGGIDKHVLPQGEKAIREHLERLKPTVSEGGFIPIPDHRIPPHCSYDQFRTYLR